MYMCVWLKAQGRATRFKTCCIALAPLNFDMPAFLKLLASVLSLSVNATNRDPTGAGAGASDYTTTITTTGYYNMTSPTPFDPYNSFDPPPLHR